MRSTWQKKEGEEEPMDGQTEEGNPLGKCGRKSISEEWNRARGKRKKSCGPEPERLKEGGIGFGGSSRKEGDAVEGGKGTGGLVKKGKIRQTLRPAPIANKGKSHRKQ